MAGSVLAQIDVTDLAVFEEHRGLAGPTIEKYGGSIVVRDGATEAVEGDWDPKLLIILRFDSLEKAKEWYYSPEYTEARKYRHRSANTQLIFAEGL